MKSWRAEFTQTRTLRVLKQPLTASGRVWFEAPNRFRWEIGEPAQTIALRLPDAVYVVYPRLDRVEKYPVNAADSSPWRAALAMFEAGFPQSRRELESSFRVLSQSESGSVVHVDLQPRSSGARHWMRRVSVDVDVDQPTILSTEIEFPDGSTMRNDFTRPQLNPPIDPKRFSADFGPSTEVVEPTRRER